MESTYEDMGYFSGLFRNLKVVASLLFNGYGVDFGGRIFNGGKIVGKLSIDREENILIGKCIAERGLKGLLLKNGLAISYS